MKEVEVGYHDSARSNTWQLLRNNCDLIQVLLQQLRLAWNPIRIFRHCSFCAGRRTHDLGAWLAVLVWSLHGLLECPSNFLNHVLTTLMRSSLENKGSKDLGQL